MQALGVAYHVFKSFYFLVMLSFFFPTNIKGAHSEEDKGNVDCILCFEIILKFLTFEIRVDELKYKSKDMNKKRRKKKEKKEKRVWL